MVNVHALRLRSPLIGMEGIRQFQFARSPDGLDVSITVSQGSDPESISRNVERALRDALEKLDVQAERIAVEVVDRIERVGTGSKEKLVAKPARQ